LRWTGLPARFHFLKNTASRPTNSIEQLGNGGDIRGW
jgi:hypothetical protein